MNALVRKYSFLLFGIPLLFLGHITFHTSDLMDSNSCSTALAIETTMCSADFSTSMILSSWMDVEEKEEKEDTSDEDDEVDAEILHPSVVRLCNIICLLNECHSLPCSNTLLAIKTPPPEFV